ncbi:UDP-phosphate N-acetylgalactosaminyl-1-phosphate transferase [Clostridium perfringens]|uniref:sugar transferase n=1 Tax=Clostridium perfringens TaxID=1502 RepID=UPI00103F0871|nr:sugar transferase [Clostridium perfringens]MDM0626632.1 sugar transferase [Clostridium perfringens]TBX15210.1 UDP-phosphate N-acetylgalactosaminyl-1-phosphate transferase [Clostridium perfringens]
MSEIIDDYHKNEVSQKDLYTNEKNLFIKESKIYLGIKRFADISLSLIGLIIGVPIVIIASICIVLESRGNPLYSQMRVGLNNKEFKMYKIRSMRIDAEADGAQWAKKDDPRITKVGKFIRKTRIDEIPQLFNVLKGDMSIIGPRPEREIFYKQFEKTIPDFRKRLLVKPGLTGYAQVNGGYDLTPDEKLRLDLYYESNQSIKLDILIILKTFRVLLTGEGAR